jgi:hypothetical protein
MNPHLEMVRRGADERRRPLEGYVDPGHGASSKYSYLVKALILYSRCCRSAGRRSRIY